MPQQEAPKRRKDPSKIKFEKSKNGIPQFSPKKVDELARKGFTCIYNLSGKPLESITKEPIHAKQFWNAPNGELESYDFPVKPIQVAINPHQPTILFSNNKSMLEQKKLIKEYPKERGIRRVKGVMGEASHVTELALLHLKTTGEYLLGKQQGYIFARTTTPTGQTPEGENLYANVGCFSEALGMRIRSETSAKHPYIVALPFLVPA